MDLFRLLCALLVVAIHTMTEYPPGFTPGYYFTHVLTRIAVPYFFCITGYYYMGALLNGKKVYRKYMGKLLTVYCIWSFIYLIRALLQMLLKGKPDWGEFFGRTVFKFFIDGGNGHLWFFPAIIIAISVVTLCYRLGVLKYLGWACVLFYLLGSLGCSYYEIAVKIPVFSEFVQSRYAEWFRRTLSTALPSFLLGYWIFKMQGKLQKISTKRLWLLLGGVGVLYLAEGAVVIVLQLQYNLVLSFFLLPLLAVVVLLLLRYPLPSLTEAAYTSRVVANFTYYAHPLYHMFVRKVLFARELLPVSDPLAFVLTCLLTLPCGWVVRKLDKKWLNKLVL